MRLTKRIFLAYLVAIVLMVAGMGLSLAFTPPRDPHTLYIEYFGSIRTLDPAEVNDTVGALFVGQVYESLYNFKFQKPYELMPELASAMPETSPDGKTLTIHLRKGIHFYDPEKKVFPAGVGPELKARDVIYSFKRICDFNLASANYSVVFQNQIVGVDEWWNYTQNTAPKNVDWDRPVEGFQALDDYTIRLVMTHPNPQMIYNLANQWTGIVSRDAVKYWKEALRRHPVGTGAYILTQLLPEQSVIMEANPVYRGRPDIDGDVQLPESQKGPKIKRVEYDYFGESIPPWLLFTQGLYDSSGIPKESFEQAIRVETGELTPALEKKGVVLSKSASPITDYIGFNMQDPVVGKNKPLRQAISLALDRATLIKNFWNGRGIPAIGPIPPGFVTFDPHEVNPWTRYNLDLARQNLKEAEQINGGPIPELSIVMRDADTGSRQMAEFFAAQLKKIGLSLRPEFRDFARYLEMVDNRQTQLFDAGWVADYPDEQDFLQLFCGKSAPAGGVNASAYVNPEFDRLYDEAAVMLDSPRRRELYKQMERIVMDDCPWVIEDYELTYSLNYDWVKGILNMDYGYGFTQFLTLDEKLRADRLAHH